MAKLAETPLMKQHAEMKLQHPDAILLFRVGDFYETFFEGYTKKQWDIHPRNISEDVINYINRFKK